MLLEHPAQHCHRVQKQSFEVSNACENADVIQARSKGFDRVLEV